MPRGHDENIKILGKNSIAGLVVHQSTPIEELVSDGGTVIAKSGQTCVHSGMDAVLSHIRG